MAELTERDKRTLLGENYKEVLAKAEQDGGKTALQHLRASQIDKNGSRQFTAFALALVGAILFVTNYYAVSGPSIMLVGVLGITAFFGGAGWFAHLRRSQQKLGAT